MKKNEIKVGSHYIAKVGASITTVRVDAIREKDTRFTYGNRQETAYDVTNLRTGRKTTFRSAMKFRCNASDINPVKVATYSEAKAAHEAEEAGRDPHAAVEAVKETRVNKLETLAQAGTITAEEREEMKHLQRCDIETYELDEDGNEVVEGEQRQNPIQFGAKSAVAVQTAATVTPTTASLSPTPNSLASRLAAMPVDDAPHLIVEARAGSGKTFTLISGVVNMFKDTEVG